jgi:hypothetical protein
MDYLIAVIAISVLVKLFLEALKNTDPKLQQKIQDLLDNEEYSEEDIVANIYKYWAVRLESAISKEEKAACLHQADKTEIAFRMLIAETPGIAAATTRAKQWMEQSADVLPFKPDE